MKKNIFKSRRFKHGTLATVVTAGFLVAVILVNLIVTMLLDRFPISIDMTPTGAMKLSEQSIDYVKKINQDVTIFVLAEEKYFASQGQYFVQTQEILKRYTQYNSRIKVKYVDLDKNPDFTAKYEGMQLTEGDILVDGVNRDKRFSVGELFNTDTDTTTGYTTITSSKAEQVVTSALMYVTDDSPTTVGILTGHSEQDMTALESLLNSNNYDTESIRLLTQTPGEHIDTLVLAAPTSDYSDEEIEKLDKFLYNDGKFGKNLVYMAGINQPKLPKLEAFLEQDWGVQVGTGYIVETDSSRTVFSPRYILQNYVNDNFSKDLANPNLEVMVPDSRPLTAVYEEAEGRRTTTVMLSTNSSAVVTPENVPEDWDPNTGEKAARNTAILSTRTTVVDNEEKASNVMVFGSVSMFADGFINFSSFNNSAYTVNMFNILNNKEDNVQITPVALGGQQLTLTEDKVQILSITFYAVIPLVVLAIGVIVWLRRRHA